MLQKLLFESPLVQTPNKSTKDLHLSFAQLSKNPISFSRKILYHKYSKFEYSFSLFCTNNLIFNEKCRIVARFKDFLVLDDSTEFLRRFYSKKELKARLKKIYNFYESYCKIFPNYMILPESQFLYKNIGKKQKMIDAFNEIKKEEEENRKHLKLGKINENMKNKEENIVFTKKIQESIERYHPSLSNLLSNTLISEIGGNGDIGYNDKNNKTITLNSQLPLNLIERDKLFLSYKNSFLEQDKNIIDNSINSQNSIYKIVQMLNNNNNKIDNINKNTNNNIIYNKINKIENKNNNNSSSFNNNKIISKNNTNNNNNTTSSNSNNNTIKINNKKFLNLNKNRTNNNFNSINNNSNKNVFSNKKKPNSNNKNKENNCNTNKNHKFISHKQTVSVPLASNMLNSHDNNILDGKNTIKIINNINNIIINDDKNKTINNGMIININNNYFQLKNPKKFHENIIKRVKSKEEQKKEELKGQKIFKAKEEKDEEFQHFKYPIEKKACTSLNTLNNNRQNKKFLMNENRSPNKKKESNKNLDNNKNNNNNKNPHNCYISINNNNKQNNANKNNNITINSNNKKNNNKIKESKTLYNNSHTNPNNHRNSTETNTNHNNNVFGNKLIKNKEKPKLGGLETIDFKKLSINRKMVNNYFTTTQKKKASLGRFQTHESSSLNTYNNNFNTTHKKKDTDFSEKIEALNIYNTIQNKNNPIKIKLDKNKVMRKIKTNSLHLNKKDFLNSFNITKDKNSGNKFEIINLNENKIKFKKKSIKKYLTNKIQSNSEAELMREMNSKKILMNTFTSKSLKKDIFSNNEKNNDINNNKNSVNNNKNEIKKINVKEMKEKYHNLLRGNKFTHGSYDTTNRLHLFKKFQGLNNITNNVASNINNNTITALNKIKRSPLNKLDVLSPGKKIKNNLSNYIKSPIKNKCNRNSKEIYIENNNNNKDEGKLNLIGMKKQLDANNKKMKFIKK